MTNEERDRAIRELQNSINVGLCPDIESRKAAIEALSQQTEDAISRQAAIEAVKFGITYASAINTETGEVKPMFVESNDELQKAINRICELPSVAPKAEPCEDAISRQAVMDCFKKWQPYMATRLWDFEQELSRLPSITPKQRTGHWVDTGSGQECSECHEIQYGYDNYRFYCPNCGAKMEEEA